MLIKKTLLLYSHYLVWKHTNFWLEVVQIVYKLLTISDVVALQGSQNLC